MTPERYMQLNKLADSAVLTAQERDEGWHYCYDWDFLLVGPGTEEWAACVCVLNDGAAVRKLK